MKIRLTIAAIAIAAMVGCEKNNSSGINDLKVSFTSDIDLTRVEGAGWETNDQIGVMVTSDNALLTSYRYNNCYDVTYTDPTLGSFTAATQEDQIYYPVVGDETIHFYAYYPYNQHLDESSLSYTIDITDQGEPKKIDFMEATTRGTSGYNKDSGTVALSFNRNMAKVTFRLVPGDGLELADITRIYAKGYSTSATYDFESNEFGLFSGADQEIELYSEGNDYYSMILFPESSASHKGVYFTTSNGDVPLDMDFCILERGVNKIYSVKVSQTEAKQEKNRIDGWGPAIDSGELENEFFENE